MTVYLKCGVCGARYRLDSQESAKAHHQVHGHEPLPPAPPPTTPAGGERAPTAGELVMAAARRCAALEVEVRTLRAQHDLLAELADTWDRTGHPDRAAELKSALSRPAVRPLEER